MITLDWNTYTSDDTIFCGDVGGTEGPKTTRTSTIFGPEWLPIWATNISTAGSWLCFFGGWPHHLIIAISVRKWRCHHYHHAVHGHRPCVNESTSAIPGSLKKPSYFMMPWAQPPAETWRCLSEILRDGHDWISHGHVRGLSKSFDSRRT